MNSALPNTTHHAPAERFRHGLFACSIFLAAYLLFQIEPLIGKIILPHFGGSPAVWTSCMLFFQLLLLAGYSYAHLSINWLTSRQQALLHSALLVLTAVGLPINNSLPPTDAPSSHPAWAVTQLLLSEVGLPFFVLSTTSPLLQAWYARSCPDRSPYPLYALSNTGSLLALISYPFVIEPYFPLSQQTIGWSLGVGLFIVFGGLLSLLCSRLAQSSIAMDHATPLHALPSVKRWFLWLSLPAVSSSLLLSITNALCQDVASVPFLWIVPLVMYLVSFILCFARYPFYQRRYGLPLAIAGGAGLVFALYNGSHLGLFTLTALYSGGLLSCCMLLHGELFRLRPPASQLTAYYLAHAIGGVLGGLFVAVIAPRVFSIYLELPISLLATFGLGIATVYPHEPSTATRHYRQGLAVAVLAWLGLAVILGAHTRSAYRAQQWVSRDFYGVLRIEERDTDQPDKARRVLRHGAIDHGFQYLAAAKQQQATSYYRPETGIGLALQHLPTAAHRRIGLVGLGVGTLLAYGQADDSFRIYDINPTVVALAQSHFSFVGHSAAAVSIITDDARLALQREPPNGFDLLILDAFSGDAIPMHLLTLEALQLYGRHLQPDGVLAIHIANRNLDLRPLLKGLSQQLGLDVRVYRSPPVADDFGLYQSDWALLSRNLQVLNQPALLAAQEPLDSKSPAVLWTDDFSNLFTLLK